MSLIELLMLVAIVIVLIGAIITIVIDLIDISDLFSTMNDIKENGKYVEMSFDNFKNLFYILKTRCKETGDPYPSIDNIGHETVPIYLTLDEGDMSGIERCPIVFPSFIDCAKYSRFANELETEKTEQTINSNQSSEAYESMIKVLQSEKDRHMKEYEASVEETKDLVKKMKENVGGSQPLEEILHRRDEKEKKEL